MGLIFAIILFSLIILSHELGHFLLAKANGIHVVEFSLGMGKRIISKQIGATRYSLKILPFGGSCMMKGEDLGDQSEGSFGSKTALQRISVIAAGPVFNFLTAFILACVVVGISGYTPAYLADVMSDSPAYEAGLRPGDRIVSLNGKRIHLDKELSFFLSIHEEDGIDFGYERDGKTQVVHVVRRYDETEGTKLFGFVRNVECIHGNLLDTLRYGCYEVRFWLDMTVTSLKMLVRGQVGVKDMSGPVGVVDAIDDVYTEAVQYGWLDVLISMLNMAILLSANLGVMNLLPIPALDGGRLFFLLIELIRGKRVSPEKEGMVHFVGLMILMVFMVFILFQDVLRLF